MSSLQATAPILYVNMGGEMLYVLQKRLQTQKISPDKTIQVMNEVIYAMLKPQQLSIIFDSGSGASMGLDQLKALLERVVLSSIMKLDANSMSKLFDLMIMMVKYQLTTASGPREVLLSMLNHLDAVRDMAVERSLGQHVDACHRLILDTYAHMTHKQLWQIRCDCLRQIQHHQVRVSILLRLGMQNQDASFNRLIQRYDEKYQDRKHLLDNVRILDYNDEDSAPMGALSLFGDRATLLGKNVYSSTYGHVHSSGGGGGDSSHSLDQMLARSNKAMRQELETLAVQLGKEESAPTRPFSLHLFPGGNDSRMDSASDSPPAADNANNQSPAEQHQQAHSENNANRPIHHYKNNLIDNVNSDFADTHTTSTGTVDLINLFDLI